MLRAVAGQGLGTADDLHDLGGDGVLTGAVMMRERLLMSSSALSVALFMAR